MEKADIEIIKKVFWDYQMEDDEIEEHLKALNRGIIADQWFFLRILENFTWHFLIKLIPQKLLLTLLTDDVISKIRSKRRREDLANTKSLLQSRPLPFPRWDHIHDERTRHGLLSNRWYGVK
jgi:hypothetical protein